MAHCSCKFEDVLFFSVHLGQAPVCCVVGRSDGEERNDDLLVT